MRASLIYSTNHLRANANLSPTFQKLKKGEHFKLISRSQHYPETKAKPGYLKRRKLIRNILDEHALAKPR
jgi:hypothetical protein